MKRILVIGGGSIGQRHLRCFLNTQRASVALCEVNADLRREFVEQYSSSSAFASLEDALQQDFDAAVICTPAHLHISMAGQIAKRGVPMMIEKPLSIATDGVQDLMATVASRETAVSVAYVLRHHPALQAMKRAVDSGEFGRPVEFVMTGGQHFPFYRPAYRDIYYANHATGGGAIQDALTHVVNAAEWIVGPITKLVADADHCVLEGVEVEDTVHLITRHGNVLGSFSLNQHQRPNETTLTVVCQSGAVRCEMHASRWSVCREANAAWTIEEEFVLERDDLFTKQADAFLDELETGVAPTCSLAEAYQTLCVNLATLESVRKGSWVSLSPRSDSCC